MERTHEQIWIELRDALENFQAITADHKTPIVETTIQRLKIERLLVELDDSAEKAA